MSMDMLNMKKLTAMQRLVSHGHILDEQGKLLKRLIYSIQYTSNLRYRQQYFDQLDIIRQLSVEDLSECSNEATESNKLMKDETTQTLQMEMDEVHLAQLKQDGCDQEDQLQQPIAVRNALQDINKIIRLILKTE